MASVLANEVALLVHVISGTARPDDHHGEAITRLLFVAFAPIVMLHVDC